MSPTSITDAKLISALSFIHGQLRAATQFSEAAPPERRLALTDHILGDLEELIDELTVVVAGGES